MGADELGGRRTHREPVADFGPGRKSCDGMHSVNFESIVRSNRKVIMKKLHGLTNASIRGALALLFLTVLSGTLRAQTPAVSSDKTSYFTGEDITITFTNGPGN